MKTQTETAGGTSLPFNATAQAVGRGPTLSGSLYPKRSVIGGLLNLAWGIFLRVINQAGSGKDPGRSPGAGPGDRVTFPAQASTQPSTALCASHHG
jgi:hypothetical protein